MSNSSSSPNESAALLIQNGRVIDPSQGLDTVADVLIEDGRVSKIEPKTQPKIAAQGVARFDATGLIVAPGFIDLHTHLREPGREHAETIESGGKAAAAGGFTSVLAMPNSLPVNDSVPVTHYIVRTARERSPVNVYPVGAISEGSKGERLAPIRAMREAGTVAISDDGMPVMNSNVMRQAMQYAASLGIVVMDHCEDLNLTAGGLIHEGFTSIRCGLRGIPASSEEVMVARDILLASETGARFHVAHLSTAGSMEMIREAKRKKLAVTCEVTPHHFALIDEDIALYDTNYKMKPPLRSRQDRDAMIEGFADGTVDAIATDHAPHVGSEKMQEFDLAPFGILGLETAVGLAFDRLLHPGHITLTRMVELLSTNPAKIAGIERGTLKPGAVADVSIVDPERKWKFDMNRSFSRSRNTPFDGIAMRGGPVATIVAGKIVWKFDR